MSDITGVAELLRMFEKHFGPFMTKLLLASIGITVVGYCMSKTYHMVIHPGLIFIMQLTKGTLDPSSPYHPLSQFTFLISWYVICMVIALCIFHSAWAFADWALKKLN